MASKFVVVQPLSVQIAIFLPRRAVARHQWFRRDNQFFWHGSATKQHLSGGSYGASAQTATAVVNMQNTDITVDRNGSLALGLWALSGGRITGDSLAITGAAGAREFMP